MQSPRRRSCIPKIRLFNSRERCKWPTTAWVCWFTKKKRVVLPTRQQLVLFILRLTTSCAWRWWAKPFYAIFPCKKILQSCLFGVLWQPTVVFDANIFIVPLRWCKVWRWLVWQNIFWRTPRLRRLSWRCSNGVCTQTLYLVFVSIHDSPWTTLHFILFPSLSLLPFVHLPHPIFSVCLVFSLVCS